MIVPKRKMMASHEVLTSVGQVSRFYDTHQVQFSQSNLQKGLVLPKKILCWARVSTFFLKIKSVLTMLVLRNLRTGSYPLLVFTNRVLFYIFNYKLKLRCNNY
jgi:hypothetical protein